MKDYDAEIYSYFELDVGSFGGGWVFNDSSTQGRHPFPDGTGVRTSPVRSRVGDIITTASGTRYKVLKEYPTE